MRRWRAYVLSTIGAMDDTTLLSLPRMARRLGVTSNWLREESDAGRVPCLKAGNRYLFSPDAVLRVLAERAARLEAAR
jgi:hypothetical protein